MNLIIPKLSLVVLIGISGSGKSTFARAHFRPTEVISSDFCRALIADDENDQSVTADAFEILHVIASKRLAAGRLTVVDATNVQQDARKPLVALAKQHYVLPVAVVLDVPEKLCLERNAARTDRALAPHIVRRQREQLRRSVAGLRKEGFRYVYVLKTPEDIATATIDRPPLYNDRTDLHGPFDIIGDVHGCFDELRDLLTSLGYTVEPESGGTGFQVTPPEGRTAVFLGDLVDRGPGVVPVLRLVMGMVAAGTALCVPGNHDIKLMRALRGRDVQIAHGLAESLAQLSGESQMFRTQVADFLDGLVSHYVLDDGKLVVAHAGMREEMQGRAAGAVREFALYGDTTGETDEFGLPVRHNWAAEYRGYATVIHGHTPVPEPEWLNNTMNIDTGCVFGGALTALRYPERELLSVAARHVYTAPMRPFLPPVDAAPILSAQQEHDDLLNLADVTGTRRITTTLARAVTIRPENAAAALEVMSRFAADPRWLIYLPPTMSPVETSALPGVLEHPAEAFAYYRRAGVAEVVCEEKHMGSRAIVVVCRDEDTARHRFGIMSGETGIVYTRTGRRFFEDTALETALLARVRAAMDTAGWWDEFATDWACLDCELLPWSAKAQQLIRDQYAATAVAGRVMLPIAEAALASAVSRGVDVGALAERTTARREAVDAYAAAYRPYCWPIHSLDDLVLAPFHVLATEGQIHTNRDHVWHINMIARLAAADPALLRVTATRTIDVTDAGSIATGSAWWEKLTGRGGEGMVVKPRAFISQGAKGLVQPAMKVRGREYLRLIYGPEYMLPDNFERLRARNLGGKRALALREFALGIESLTRFVAREPLRRVHECVFAVLALESEPIDPRL